MRRHEFEHVIGAAANVVGETEFVVIGSQAILGAHPDAPEPLLRSMEADLYPRASPEKAGLIDGALGDGSPFHRQFGYYAHGVGPETAKAPAGWERRLVRVPMAARPGSRGEPVALCLEPHDLVLAKCAAGRDRDWDFAREAIVAGLVDLDGLFGGVADLPLDGHYRAHIRAMLGRFSSARG
ncbi:MAG: converved hypothetical protein [uncultured Solirubrobacterales bacterium]|uniref:DUF6036 domain-containing protein n=1 Tax=uncultured Solirubrobacterales bacterium TaxID=768556 RepID=A0A6J4TAW0_9ACTN|nr:MAG: converved hypothetical protein [uncultured Solirubrobacterales bacterium]